MWGGSCTCLMSSSSLQSNLLNPVPSFLTREWLHHCEFMCIDTTTDSGLSSRNFCTLAGARGCKSEGSRCQQLKETRVWLDGQRVQNPVVEKAFVCVCVCSPQSAREGECQWDTGLLRFAQYPLCSGGRNSPLSCWHYSWTWNYRTKVPHPRAGGIPSMSQSSTSSSYSV